MSPQLSPLNGQRELFIAHQHETADTTAFGVMLLLLPTAAVADDGADYCHGE